jgi:hypothetical protein
MNSRFIASWVAFSLLSLAACSRDAEDKADSPQSAGKAVEPSPPPSPAENPAKPAKRKMPGSSEDRDPEFEEPEELMADAEGAGSVDLLENPAFKKYFDDLLKGHSFNDEEKKRIGEVIHLLRAMDPEKFDNQQRPARLGLTGKAAERLIDTAATGDVGGLIDSLLSEIEEIAFDPIDTPTGVASDGGVIFHIDEKAP